MDSRDPIFSGAEEALEANQFEGLREEYPDAMEEVDNDLPEPLIDEIMVTLMVDSDHAHNKVTRRSITGILAFLGRTPVYWSSKRQGAIEVSTYGAEFCAMQTAVEETIAIRYSLQAMGVKVESAFYLFGDNLGVVLNATVQDSLLKKKHVALSFHKTREATAASIVHPVKTDGKKNHSDFMTKLVPQATFNQLTGDIFHG